MAETRFATCPLCEATCGLAIDVEGDRVVSIRGDRDDVFSRGYICPKATALQDLHEDRDRLRVPMKRTASGWRELSWNQAYDEVAERLSAVRDQHGRHALGIYLGNPTVHSLGALLFGQLFLRTVRTRNRYSATSTDQLPHMLAGLLMFGHQLLLPVPDIDRTSYLLMLGANPLASNGSLMTAPGVKKRLAGILERGGRVVVIDPRRTETAEVASEHLFIHPGSDAMFLAALTRELLEGGATGGHLADQLDGVDELRRAVAPFTPERTAEATGIDAEVTRRIAREFTEADGAVCYGRIGVSTQEFGGLCAWLLNCINILTGNLDRPGGSMFPTPAADLRKFLSKSGERGSFNRYQSRGAGLPEFGGELPASALADEIERPGQHQLRALITHAANPVLSSPNGSRLDQALGELDFMVSIDIYINETTRHADIILPPTVGLERDHYDLIFYVLAVRNVANWSPAVVPRSPEQQHDWEIFAELTRRLEPQRGLRGLGSRALLRTARALGPRGLLDLLLRFGPHRLSVRKLEAHPHGIDLGPLSAQLPGLLDTPEKRIRICPDEYVADLDRLTRRTRPAAGELRLIGRRQLRSNNSWLHNSHRLVKGKPRCTLLIHPDDASARGLKDGDTAELSSRTGAIHVPVEVSDAVMPGVVSLPHGWGHGRKGVRLRVAAEAGGVSMNDVTDEEFLDRLSGTAGLSGLAVEVKQVASAISGSSESD